MKIGVIRLEKSIEVYSTCSMETFLERVKKGSKGKYILQEGIRDKLPLGKVSHLGRLLKKWEVPNKRTLKGSLYYLKKLPKQG